MLPFLFICTANFFSPHIFFFSMESQFHCHGNLHFGGQFPCLYEPFGMLLITLTTSQLFKSVGMNHHSVLGLQEDSSDGYVSDLPSAAQEVETPDKNPGVLCLKNSLHKSGMAWKKNY